MNLALDVFTIVMVSLGGLFFLRGTPGPLLRLSIGLLCAAVAAGLGAVVLLLPEPAPTLVPLVAENLAPTGLGNPVTGVLLAHRAIDTLLESVVLLPALIGVTIRLFW